MDVFKSSLTAERKSCCMVCTWMDDEFIVSIDAVVCGELVVHCAALMQNACHPESNLCQRQSSNLLAVHFYSILEAGFGRV